MYYCFRNFSCIRMNSPYILIMGPSRRVAGGVGLSFLEYIHRLIEIDGIFVPRTGDVVLPNGLRRIA